VVPFAAGGAVDTVRRVLAQKLQDSLGKPTIVDNRPGNSGNIGRARSPKRANDGHTLLMAALTTHAMNATLMQGQTGYDLDKDFAAVSVVGFLPLVLVVNSVACGQYGPELVTLAKSEAGVSSRSALPAAVDRARGGRSIQAADRNRHGARALQRAPRRRSSISWAGRSRPLFATAPTALSQLSRAGG
jgi:tripartite-type tricarboxylate transporter receptor subunit TctC